MSDVEGVSKNVILPRQKPYPYAFRMRNLADPETENVGKVMQPSYNSYKYVWSFTRDFADTGRAMFHLHASCQIDSQKELVIKRVIRSFYPVFIKILRSVQVTTLTIIRTLVRAMWRWMRKTMEKLGT